MSAGFELLKIILFLLNFLSECEKEEASLNVDDGAIFITDVPELSHNKLVQMQLDSLVEECTLNDNSVSSDVENSYPEVQVINGVVYVVMNQINDLQNVWVESNDKPKSDVTDAICDEDNQSDDDVFKNLHKCPREDCTKRFSTIHHLKVDIDIILFIEKKRLWWYEQENFN